MVRVLVTGFSCQSSEGMVGQSRKIDKTRGDNVEASGKEVTEKVITDIAGVRTLGILKFF